MLTQFQYIKNQIKKDNFLFTVNDEEVIGTGIFDFKNELIYYVIISSSSIRIITNNGSIQIKIEIENSGVVRELINAIKIKRLQVVDIFKFLSDMEVKYEVMFNIRDSHIKDKLKPRIKSNIIKLDKYDKLSEFTQDVILNGYHKLFLVSENRNTITFVTRKLFTWKVEYHIVEGCYSEVSVNVIIGTKDFLEKYLVREDVKEVWVGG